jgi:molybdate transport system ATP-binding protein
VAHQRVGVTLLTADLRVRRDGFALEVDLCVAAGEVVALVGPNGAGKTTALRLLAGLLRLDAGRVAVGSDPARVLDDPAASRFVPTEQRSVGMVFQDALLFPHLSARDNVAFGPRARGTGKRAATAQASGWLDRVGLADRAHARPGALSGGQAQRVALARALVTAPDLLLLDEPLAALDAATRVEVRAELARHLGDYAGATVLVTHDPLDAMVLADRLVVIEHGRVVQEGSPAQVARAPRTDYVAQLVGLNLHRGTAEGNLVTLAAGGRLVVAEPAQGAVLVAFSPRTVSLHRARPEGSARNVWAGRVAGIEQHGATVRVSVDGVPPVLADVTPGAVAELGLAPGQELWVSLKATEVTAYPAGL